MPTSSRLKAFQELLRTGKSVLSVFCIFLGCLLLYGDLAFCIYEAPLLLCTGNSHGHSFLLGSRAAVINAKVKYESAQPGVSSLFFQLFCLSCSSQLSKDLVPCSPCHLWAGGETRCHNFFYSHPWISQIREGVLHQGRVRLGGREGDILELSKKSPTTNGLIR